MEGTAFKSKPCSILLLRRTHSSSDHQSSRNSLNPVTPRKAYPPRFVDTTTVWFWTSLLAGGSPIGSSGVDKEEKEMIEAECLGAKTSVWWHRENKFPIPEDLKAIAQNIKSALANLSYRGPVSIFAYGDISNNLFSSTTGMSLKSLPTGEELNSKYSRVKKMIVEMIAWALENAAPANILLISGDFNFCSTVEALEKKGFNILLGTDMDEMCAPMIAVAKTAWPYIDLLAGEPPAKDSSDRNVQIQSVA